MSRRKQVAPRHVDFDESEGQPPQTHIATTTGRENSEEQPESGEIISQHQTTPSPDTTTESSPLPPTFHSQTSLDYHKRLYVARNKAEIMNTQQSTNRTIDPNIIMEKQSDSSIVENHHLHPYIPNHEQKEFTKNQPESLLLCPTSDDPDELSTDKDCDDMKKNIEDIVHELDKELDTETRNNINVSENKPEHIDDSSLHHTDENTNIDHTDDIANDDEDVDENDTCNNNISNVKLEALKNTRVAVAQIVENNFPSSDMVPSLMQTIYTLWQQQMMQCHMLEVVRQHLVKIARDRNIQLPSLPQMSDMSVFPGSQHPDSGLDVSLTSPMSPGCSISEVDDDDIDIDEEEHLLGNSENRLRQPSHHTPYQPHKTTLQQHIDTTSPSAGAEAPRMDSGLKSDVGTAVDRSHTDDHSYKYKCHVCYKVFGSDTALQSHARSHIGEHVFECDVCHQKFGNRDHLKIHYERHLFGDRESSQDHLVKGIQLPKPSELSSAKPDKHIPSTTNDQKPEAHRQPHILPHHSESTKFDQTSPRTDTHLHNHIRPQFQTLTSSSPMVGQVPPVPLPSTHNPMMSPFKSPPLGMHPPPGMGGNMPPFYRHSILPVEDDDDVMEQFMEIDKSETSKLEDMVKNIETKLTDPNQCAVCKRILSCKSALQMHYRTHTGERPFKCKICGRAFTTKGNLKTHMGVHRMKPPIRPMHQCPICQKQFTNPLVLQQHMQNHNREMPRMFPGGPPHPGMMPPNPFMTFGGMPMMPPPHMMSKFPPYMPHHMGGLDLRKPLEHDDDLSEFGDDQSEMGSRCDMDRFSEVTDGSAKRSRVDGDNEESVKRQRTDYESENESTDDEEVPIEQSERPSHIRHERIEPSVDDHRSDRVHNASFNREEEEHPNEKTNIDTDNRRDEILNNRRDFLLNDRKNIPLAPPRINFPSFQSPYLSHSENPSPYPNTSLSALEERVKALEKVGKQPRESSLEEEIKQKLEGSNRGGSMYPYLPDRSPDSSRPGLSPGSKSETAASDYSITQDYERGTPKSASPGPPPLLKPYNFMDLQHPMNFAAGRPGLGTTCDVCFKTFACKSALEIHYRSHTKEKPFRCTLCDRGFSTRGNLKQHFLTHKIRDLQEAGIDASEYSGENSNDGSVNLDNHTPHKEPHSPKTSPDKPEGGYHPDSDQKSEASYHLTSPHHMVGQSDTSRPVNPVQPLQREMMDDFNNANNLRHICQVCQKPFSSSSALQIHMRTHTGERPFKCNVCGKAFTTKGNLKVHMSTHEDRTVFTRRGRRMSMDGVPRYDGFPSPVPGFPSSVLHSKSGPEFFIPRFPFMAGYPAGLNSFMPRPNEIPVIQSSMNGVPMGLMSPDKRDIALKSSSYSGSGNNEGKSLEHREQPRQISQAS